MKDLNSKLMTKMDSIYVYWNLSKFWMIFNLYFQGFNELSLKDFFKDVGIKLGKNENFSPYYS